MSAMTAVLRPEQTPTAMPGWGIVTDLLPPEILSARRAKRIRKLVLIALLFVTLLAIGGYGYGRWQVSLVRTDIAAEQAHTTALLAEEARYGTVLQMQADTAQVGTQLSGLLADDVDVPTLITAVRGALPPGGSVSQLSVTLSDGTGATGTGVAAAPGTVPLDTSGQSQIGSLQLIGQAPSMNAVAAYVLALGKIPGVASVYPTSQQMNGRAVDFTVQLVLTDKLLTHRYAGVAATAPQAGGR